MKPFLKSKAIFLRKKGLSVSAIAKNLRISKGTASLWVRGILLTESQKERLIKNIKENQKKFVHDFSKRENSPIRDFNLKVRNKYQEEGREIARRNDPEFIAGIMLYWAEGSKTRNVVEFSNSDLHMMALFLNFLRRFFTVNESKIALYINCHSKNGLPIDKIKMEWLKVLNLTPSNIRKICIDRDKRSLASNSRSRLVYGVCTLNLCRTDIVQKIYGAIQEFGHFKNDKWVN